MSGKKGGRFVLGSKSSGACTIGSARPAKKVSSSIVCRESGGVHGRLVTGEKPVAVVNARRSGTGSSPASGGEFEPVAGKGPSGTGSSVSGMSIPPPPGPSSDGPPASSVPPSPPDVQAARARASDSARENAARRESGRDERSGMPTGKAVAGNLPEDRPYRLIDT